MVGSIVAIDDKNLAAEGLERRQLNSESKLVLINNVLRALQRESRPRFIGCILAGPLACAILRLTDH